MLVLQHRWELWGWVQNGVPTLHNSKSSLFCKQCMPFSPIIISHLLKPLTHPYTHNCSMSCIVHSQPALLLTLLRVIYVKISLTLIVRKISRKSVLYLSLIYLIHPAIDLYIFLLNCQYLHVVIKLEQNSFTTSCTYMQCNIAGFRVEGLGTGLGTTHFNAQM